MVYLLPPVPEEYFLKPEEKPVNKKIKITFLGRIDPGKGIGEVIEIFKALKNDSRFECSIYGMHIPEHKESVEIHNWLKRQKDIRYIEIDRQKYSPAVEEFVKNVLKENGVAQEKVGLDVFDWVSRQALVDAGLNIVNGWPCMIEARQIKTRDELELLKQSATIAGCAFAKIRDEWLKPGVRECDIVANYTKFLLENGFEYVPALICASGRNTNPYRRWSTDKIIQDGDLVIIDIAGAGPCGYFCDFVRTFKCGKSKPTEEEKEVYRKCWEPLKAAIEAFKPGATTKDVAEKFPEYDDDKYGTCSLFQFGHSIGLSLYEGMWISRGYSLEYPEEIKQNMCFSVETYVGGPKYKQGVRIEQSIFVTDTGCEIYTTFPLEEEFLE